MSQQVMTQTKQQSMLSQQSTGSILQRAAVNATPTHSVPPIVHDVLHSPGQPLDTGTQAFMGSRFGHDFSGVRIHTDERAAESARSVNALAYTVGRDVVFGAGQYAPTAAAGKRLLAHELTHVVQQRFAASTSNPLKVGQVNDSCEKAANDTATQVSQDEKLSSPTPETTPQIQCQNATPPQGGPAPAQFSVNQAQYLQMANDAIQQISGRLVTSNTLAESIRPILSAMLKKAIWRDEKGVDHGGGSIQYPLPNSPHIILNLRLILNDQPEPPDAGEFSGKGDKDGTLVIQIRKNTTVDQLKERLFHEASHMMAWIINRPGSPGISSPHNPEVRGLTISRFNAQKDYIQKALERLAENINPKRKAAGQPIISKADLQGTATWLLGEILVRVETEVFRLFSDVQKERASSSRSMVLIGTSPNTEVSLKIVDNYIFDFSRKFLPTDRANLTSEDKSNLVILAQVLDGFFQFEIRKRFSPSAYLSAPIPREQIQIPLPPLTPPTFRPLPLP